MLESKKLFYFLGAVLVILVIFLPGHTKLQELKDKTQQLQAKIDTISIENERLKSELLRMQEDPVYQEEVIRNKLGVVRKGEVIYRIEE